MHGGKVFTFLPHVIYPKHENLSGMPSWILPEKFSHENLSGKMTSEHELTWLVSIRKELNLTQEDVADALKISTRTVINWEKGHHEPKLTIRQVKALCGLLHKSLDEIPDSFPFPDVQNVEI
jgi:DNA-binding XRE family transcriptional regulator